MAELLSIPLVPGISATPIGIPELLGINLLRRVMVEQLDFMDWPDYYLENEPE